ncbi:MAG: hypothetical protein DI563_00855 [Variovorax paradoxus]|uniref:Tyr recombinase domain-containing protein n=1 Tax=Variovorax paradoxus TaxID=34073 RepID=A0A2W5QLW3_VARPD|nr:MAG: hypothetical protein DI563_00855 [Variovorax paradoxus]
MRLSEILSARVVGGRWMLDDSKNGMPRMVPIHPRVAICARKLRPTPEAKLLKKITVQRCWQKARAKVGREDLHFHDLRHSAASELVNAGVDLYTVGRVLGHKDSRSTQRYAHLAVQTLTAAVVKIGARAARRSMRVQKITHPHAARVGQKTKKAPRGLRCKPLI